MKKARFIFSITFIFLLLFVLSGCNKENPPEIEDFNFRYAYTLSVNRECISITEEYTDKYQCDDFEEYRLEIKNNTATIIDANNRIVFTDPYVINAQGSNFTNYNFPKKQSGVVFDFMQLLHNNGSVKTDYMLSMNIKDKIYFFEATAK